MAEERNATKVPTDEEAAAARRARFGRLPERVRPSDLVESVDAESARDHREPGEPRREWGA